MNKNVFPSQLLCKEKWFYLFHMLLLMLFAYPYLQGPSNSKHVLLVLINACLVLTMVYVVSDSPKQFLVALGLGLIEIIYLSLPYLPHANWISPLASASLYLFTISLILAKLLHAPKVGIAEVYGFISIYILIGMTWALFYQLIGICYPESFNRGDSAFLPMQLGWTDYLFFSFTTLTTLGYGDIVPLTPQAQSLAIIEALTGVVFLGVGISRAIGLYLVSMKQKPPVE